MPLAECRDFLPSRIEIRLICQCGSTRAAFKPGVRAMAALKKTVKKAVKKVAKKAAKKAPARKSAARKVPPHGTGGGRP
jgi:hypothetical protein